MANYFVVPIKIIFNDQYANQEALVSKDKVKFNGDYGYVNLSLLFTNYLLIVDRNYNVITFINLATLYKLSIIKPNIVVMTLIYEDNYQTVIAELTDKMDIMATFPDYIIAGEYENLVVLKTIIDGNQSVLLYDTLLNDAITIPLNYIGTFSYNEDLQMVVAEAGLLINNHLLIFYIDKNGKLVSDYYDEETQKSYSSSLTINEIIADINVNVNGLNKN